MLTLIRAALAYRAVTQRLSAAPATVSRRDRRTAAVRVSARGLSVFGTIDLIVTPLRLVLRAPLMRSPQKTGAIDRHLLDDALARLRRGADEVTLTRDELVVIGFVEAANVVDVAALRELFGLLAEASDATIDAVARGPVRARVSGVRVAAVARAGRARRGPLRRLRRKLL